MSPPFWWRFIDVYLVFATSVWILLLLATSTASAPDWMFRVTQFAVGMGPTVVVRVATLIEGLLRRSPVLPH